MPNYLNLLGRPASQIPQLLRLPSMQSRRNSKRRIHAHHFRIEVKLRHALQAPRRTLLYTHAAPFVIGDQNLIQPVRPLWARDTQKTAYEITVVASVTSAATETPPCL